MQSIIENLAQLEQWQIDLIDKEVLSNSMPWYFSGDSVYGDNLNYFSHVLVHRKEENKNAEKNSPLTEFFINIFKKIITENGLQATEIFRASLNATFHNTLKYGTKHVDHEFDHSNFIMYFDTIDNAGTAIFENDNSTLKYISECVKFNYVIFPGLFHAQLYPPPGIRRVVFVVTFR
jgi:hypothetical protein